MHCQFWLFVLVISVNIVNVFAMVLNASLLRSSPTGFSDESFLLSNTSLLLPAPNAGYNCFPRSLFPGGEPVDRDCFLAASQFKEDPFYNDKITYSTIPGEDVRRIPVIYTYGTCAVAVGASQGVTRDEFALSSAWPDLSDCIKHCIILAKSGFRLGGLVHVGTKGFWITIGGSPDQPPWAIEAQR